MKRVGLDHAPFSSKMPNCLTKIKALAYSASRTSKDQDHLYSIYVSTYGILFFGTPHHGSNIAKMAGIARRVMSAVVPKRVMDTNGQLLDALQENSETLQNVTDQFVPLMNRFRIFFFWEQEKTHLAHTKDFVGAMPLCPHKCTRTD